MRTPPQSQVEGVNKDAHKPSARKQKSSARGDRIELSDEARKLIDSPDDIQSSRDIVLAAARNKMLSGELLNPEALRKAAERLLDSGELG